MPKTKFISAFFLFHLLSATDAAEVDFSRQILPILSNKCFACHGPDTKKKDLVRLDSYAAATKDLGGYQAINPGNLKESEFLLRIHDEDDPMPPLKKAKPLTAKEKELLTQWVNEGGNYSSHWSFVPPKKVAMPTKGNPVDAFVGQKLKSQKLDFAQEADRPTLARRAALVLTGLPPEPDQLKKFLSEAKNIYYRLDNPNTTTSWADYASAESD